MCVICCSAAGRRQPTEDELSRMFQANPHGAGYMTARGGRVEISKGYMSWADFRRAIRYEAFTDADPVIYHFRISTQAGISPEMCHPFPLSSYIDACKLLECTAPIGVAHNGIISLTTDRTDTEYSDTAHFISEFMAYLIRSPEDMHDPAILDAIGRIARSKFALMDSSGEIETIGGFTARNGILVSNTYWEARETTPRRVKTARDDGSVIRSFFDDHRIDF